MTDAINNPVGGPQCKLMIEELRKNGWTVIGPGERNPLAYENERLNLERVQLHGVIDEWKIDVIKLRRERNSEESGKLYLREELRRRRQELVRLRADLDRAKDEIVALIKAWEATKPGYSNVREIQRWLTEDMKPAVDHARKTVTELSHD